MWAGFLWQKVDFDLFFLRLLWVYHNRSAKNNWVLYGNGIHLPAWTITRRFSPEQEDMDFISRCELLSRESLAILTFLSLFWRVMEKYLGRLWTTELMLKIILDHFWSTCHAPDLVPGDRHEKKKPPCQWKRQAEIILLMRGAVTEGYWQSCRVVLVCFSSNLTYRETSYKTIWGNLYKEVKSKKVWG